MPDLLFTNEISALLSEPSTVTSLRKLPLPTTWPERDFVWLMSAEFTEPSAVVSPSNTPIGTVTVPLFVPSLAPSKQTLILCALVTPVRLTVIALVPLPLELCTDPVPEHTDAEEKVTGKANVITTV